MTSIGPKLFTYAVISDTHLNQGETECNSPYEVNKLANARMRYVVRELNARELAFVVNLGDLVHPVPAVPHLYERASTRFLEQVKDLKHKLYLVPGNHDVGDKPIAWGPAGVIRDEFLALWEKFFGPHFYAFDHADCRFVVINAQIVNSGLKAEAEQKAWLEKELSGAKGRRTFINIHYPPYLATTGEDETYDNIAEPGRTWLLNLIEKSGAEALFAGHVHNFWYWRHGGTDFYVLPSTAFVRHDYSEMYRIEPGVEAGRNDAPKLGYFLVHVHEKGHRIEIVRTYGRTVEPDAPVVAPPARVRPVHPADNARAPLGFDMRQNWMEAVQIPPSGGLDEFDRKRIRNDYPLMALWEMGVRKVRIPLRDLAAAETRARLKLLKESGHEFTLFSYCDIGKEDREAIRKHRDLIEAWEIGGPGDALAKSLEAAKAIRAETGLPIYFSKLRSKEELEGDGEKYYHVINHGYTARENEQIARLIGVGIDGLVFRVSSAQVVWDEILAAADAAKNAGLKASVHVRMSANNPAKAQDDELWATNRVAEALAAAVTRDGIKVFVDAFADVDRGYLPRLGVVDRRYNPRLGFHAVRNLYGAFGADKGPIRAGRAFKVEGGRALTLGLGTGDAVLVLPEKKGVEFVAVDGVGNPGGWRTIDLASGAIRAADASIVAGAVRLGAGAPITTPVLFVPA